MIAAIQEVDRGLGNGLDLLWRISADLKRFKAITTGHPVIMGRKTYDSIGRPLPNRLNIVITRDASKQIEGCVVVGSLEEAVAKASETGDSEIFILGGGQIYEQAISLADRLYLTIVHAQKDANIFFPDYSAFARVVEKEKHPEHDPPFTWVTLER